MASRLRLQRGRVVSHLALLIDLGAARDIQAAARDYCRRNRIPATDNDLRAMVDAAVQGAVQRRLNNLQAQINSHHPRPDPPVQPEGGPR